jgi:hypothetical protein
MQLLIPCSPQQLQQLQHQPYAYVSGKLPAWIWGTWAVAVQQRPQRLAAIILRTALPLLQGLQQSIHAGLEYANHPAAGTSSSSSSGNEAEVGRSIAAAAIATELQRCVLRAVLVVWDMDRKQALLSGGQLTSLLGSDELASTVLQQLVAAAAMFRCDEQQQQQQGFDGGVPAYHKSLLHLLPRGKAYVGAAGAAAAVNAGVRAANAAGEALRRDYRVPVLLELVAAAAPLMPQIIAARVNNATVRACPVAGLGAAEWVPLAVELQLLLAAEYEHQQGLADEKLHTHTRNVLVGVNHMLLALLWMVAKLQQQQQQGASRLQQLLQGPEPPLLLALAAPLQLLPSKSCAAGPGEQLFALQAALEAATCSIPPGEHL